LRSPEAEVVSRRQVVPTSGHLGVRTFTVVERGLRLKKLCPLARLPDTGVDASASTRSVQPTSLHRQDHTASTRPTYALGWPYAVLHAKHERTDRLIDAATHEELKRLAAQLHTTVGNTVSLAVRALRQDLVGAELTTPLLDDEVAWLDADLG
jgi:hypothetical protein